MPCCRRPNRRPYPPRVTQSAFAAPLLGASSNASSIGFSGSSPRCRRRNKQSYLFTSDAKCTYTICFPSMGPVRFTKTDGSLTTRTAPPWCCPRTLSPTLGNATLWRLSNVVCGFLYTCLWCVPCKWLLLLALYKKNWRRACPATEGNPKP